MIFKINKDVKNYSPNYLATICKIGEVYPIEGADRLVKTSINGYDVVISKDIKPGEIVVYFPVETSICEDFLSANNLYEKSEYLRNANKDEVAKIIEQYNNATGDEKDLLNAKVKSMCGYFNKHGRVRIIRFRGQFSLGFVTDIDSMVKYDSKLADVDWESLVGTQFNFIGNNEFCRKFIPPVKEVVVPNRSARRMKKRMKHVKRFNKIIDGQFTFHYDTTMFCEHVRMFKPDDEVSITVKLHGTSAIISNILIKKKYRRPVSYYEKKTKIRSLLNTKYISSTNFEKNKLKDCYVGKCPRIRLVKEYGNIYASRNTIKNRYINKYAHDFYGSDVWGCANSVFGQYLDEGMTVYGEIVGYVNGRESMIQANHDYGCNVGQWKFMPYRITITDKNGNKTEWDIKEVDEWTRNLVKAHPELEKNVMFLTILYYGKLGDLYPDINTSEHWHENLLERMKNDKENFGMELDEPLCKNKVPREGIVIRIVGDERSRAWKLKTARHTELEAKKHDKGEVDMEESA